MTQENMTQLDTDAIQRSQEKRNEIKNSIKSVAVFFLMLLVSLVIWCYADSLEPPVQNIEDPIVEKEFIVNFKLEGARPYEQIIPCTVKFKGKQSDFMTIGKEIPDNPDIRFYEYTINRSELEEYDYYEIIEYEFVYYVSGEPVNAIAEIYLFQILPELE